MPGRRRRRGSCGSCSGGGQRSCGSWHGRGASAAGAAAAAGAAEAAVGLVLGELSAHALTLPLLLPEKVVGDAAAIEGVAGAGSGSGRRGSAAVQDVDNVLVS